MHDVFVGQRGELSLRANPGTKLPLTITAVHPVAEAGEGVSRFRVRAKLSTVSNALRAGQSGVARLDAGHMSALGVLTRRLNRRLAELWWRIVG